MTPQWNLTNVLGAEFNAHNFDQNTSKATLDQLATMIEHAKEIDRLKSDYKAPVYQMNMSGGRLAVKAYPTPGYNLPLVVSPNRLTDTAWSQLLSKVAVFVYGNGKSNVPRLDLLMSGSADARSADNGGSAKAMPKRYLEHIPTDLLDMIMTYHLQHAPHDRDWQMRYIEKPANGGEEETVIRAVLGPRYPISYGNTALLQTINDLLTKHQNRFDRINLVRPSLAPDDLHLKVMYYQRDTDDGPYGLGFYLGNNECGQGRYDVMMCIQRGQCTNSLVIDQDNAVHIIHTGSAPTIKENIFTAIGQALKLGDTVLDEFLETREVEIPDFEDVVSGLALRYGNTINEAVKGVVVQYNVNRDPTKFNLINGLTWAAHAAPDLLPYERVDLEKMGGALIAAPGSLFAKAAQAAQAVRKGYEPNLAWALAPRKGGQVEGEDQ